MTLTFRERIAIVNSLFEECCRSNSLDEELAERIFSKLVNDDDSTLIEYLINRGTKSLKLYEEDGSTYFNDGCEHTIHLVL